MTTYVLLIAAGAVAKTLLPFPPFDDRVRAVWRWAWTKVTNWID